MTSTRSVLAAAVETRPAGAAPLDEVLIATGSALVLTVLLAVLAYGHRSGRVSVLARAVAHLDRGTATRDTAGWATLPLLVAMVSLVTALVGMYWDIALHIGVGRDEGPLANPAHYPIMFGLFGISAAGVLACVLPRGGQAGAGAVRLSRGWRAPVGGLLLTAAGGYALLGFPLDDVWHRLFGQDVTLWGPTHLMLIGGAGLSLVAMAVLYEEGRLGRSGPRTIWQRSAIMGGMLIGLSVFQAEFDFGVPQFRLVLHPLLVAAAAATALVAARLWIGRGGALAAAGFYLLVRGGVSVLVGPVLGELWASVPLYLGEALLVELAALALARRPLLLGAVAGLLVGTVGFGLEYAWTQVAFVLPWTPDILLEGGALALTGGVAGGVLGALLVLGLRGQLPARPASASLFAGALLALAAAVATGVDATAPPQLAATMAVTPDERRAGWAEVQVELDRTAVDGAPAWFTATGWQGGPDSAGLVVDHLEQVDETTYRTTGPVPVDGTWKTMLRLHDGSDLSAMAVYMPEDRALGEPRVAARDRAERVFDDERLLLQRELKDDVPGWLWLVAGLVVLACSTALVLALGWGTARFARSREAEAARDDRDAGGSGSGPAVDRPGAPAAARHEAETARD